MRENEKLRGEKLKSKALHGKRPDHHKALSNATLSSPSKLPEFYSQRIGESESIQPDYSRTDARRRSFAE